MNQFLPRGLCVLTGNRIKKMIAGGDNWQIYLTNLDAYVLAVKRELFNRWVFEYSLPTGIFLEECFFDCHVFISSEKYLISSLEQGPYPENGGQIEAFSIVFKAAIKMFTDESICDAIYIEEYSLLLPASFDKSPVDYSTAYGRWLTGGLSISITSIDRVSKIMSWLPKEALINSVKMAGFDIEAPEIENERTIQKTAREEMKTDSSDGIPRIAAEGKFSLVGRPELEQFFNDHIVEVVLHQEAYKRMGISFPGATILYGPPGCGKTYAVERLAEYLGWKRFDIDSSAIASSFIHDTSKKIAEVFHAAIKAAPSVLVIDEMEAFLTNREMAGTSGTHHIEEVAEFLRRIPEAVSKGVLVFAMTNMIDSVDPAVLRRGRFDHIIEVKMASAEEVEALLKVKFSELPVDETVDAKIITATLAGHPMSDITFVLREAGRIAVKQGLEFMSNDCFSQAVELLPKKKGQTKIGFADF